jgi:hypothetical protein
MKFYSGNIGAHGIHPLQYALDTAKGTLLGLAFSSTERTSRNDISLSSHDHMLYIYACYIHSMQHGCLFVGSRRTDAKTKTPYQSTRRRS